jgi:hypothetical protein
MCSSRSAAVKGHRRVAVGILVVLGCGQALQAQEPARSRPLTPSAPLFESDDVLDLTIEGPLTRVFLERDEEAKASYNSVIRYHAPGAILPETFDVELRTRGHFRLRLSTCPFPPIRLHFEREQLEQTLFASQHRIKMVTHCRTDRAEYEQYVLREYLAYRIYNLLTEESFRVRLARVTYIDTDDEIETITRYALLLEDADAMAARNGYDELEIPGVQPAQMQPAALIRFELFQYMIGNTDWDPFVPEPGDICCHNTVPIGSLRDFTVLPVPYDFDFSGLVGAEYALPNPRLLIRTVRQRRYWGLCRPPEEIDAALPAFLELREDVAALVRSIPGLTAASVRDATSYLDEFYETIGNPNRVERELLRKCRLWDN